MNSIPRDEQTCQICGRPAIGLQILGCCKVVVCEEHADSTLKSLASGERQEFGACYYVRY